MKPTHNEKTRESNLKNHVKKMEIKKLLIFHVGKIEFKVDQTAKTPNGRQNDNGYIK